MAVEVLLSHAPLLASTCPLGLFIFSGGPICIVGKASSTTCGVECGGGAGDQQSCSWLAAHLGVRRHCLGGVGDGVALYPQALG